MNAPRLSSYCRSSDSASGVRSSRLFPDALQDTLVVLRGVLELEPGFDRRADPGVRPRPDDDPPPRDPDDARGTSPSLARTRDTASWSAPAGRSYFAINASAESAASVRPDGVDGVDDILSRAPGIMNESMYPPILVSSSQVSTATT
jgi:hypothetical protein